MYKGDKMRSSHVLPIMFLVFFFIFSIHCSASFTQYLTYQFEVTKELTDHKNSVRSVVFNPDGDLIATGSEDTTVKLWNGDSGKRVKALMRHPAPVLCVAFSPDGNIVASGSSDGTISFWDVNYKERIKTLKGHEDRVLSICFSPDGKFLASGSADKTIRLWDMNSGKAVKWLVGHMAAVNSLAFSPTGRILASGSEDGTVRFWDTDSGETTGKYEESTGAVNSVCFSSDGKSLAWGAASGVIRLLDVESRQEIQAFSGHKDAIGAGNCLSFSPDGRLLVSGSADTRILVWDASSGDLVDDLKSHTAAVNSIAFSPDGRRMASASSDGAAKLWKIQIKESLEITLDAEYQGWQRGILELKVDVLGIPDLVKYQYSLDGSTWLDITEKQGPPYSMNWDTRTSILDLAETVSVRVVAERVTGATATDMAQGTFSLDNAPPKTEHNYDGLWHKEDFRIELSADDGDGTGVAVIGYKLNYGQGKDTTWNDQPVITEEGTNTLEYWSVDKLGNEEPHRILSDIKLDMTAPTFFNWMTDPENLTEDATGLLRVSMRMIDEGGSGLAGKVPQFDYHIGQDSAYDGYEDMSEGEGKVWYYDIPEPSEGWKHYMDKAIYYRTKCQDVAGNVGQGAELQKLIGSSKAPPTVKMIGEFRDWEKGTLKIEADASDTDGAIRDVQFGYSFDGISWTPIGSRDARPYSVEWDTETAIPEVEISVWVRITATDNDGLLAKYVTPRFSVDNQLPVTKNDYDGQWHKNNFAVNLEAGDGDGSGISGIKYKLNNGRERDVSSDGQPAIDGQGQNTLEYWSIDFAGNEEEHELLSDVKLDRLSPFFVAWGVEQDGSVLHVEVNITDTDSGIVDPPQLAYHIGPDKDYSDYSEMQKTGDDVWKYEIISRSASDAVGKTLFCKVSVKDDVGNLAIKPWEYEIAEETGATPVIISEPEPTKGPGPTKVEEKPVIDPVPVAETKKKEISIVWDIYSPGPFVVNDKTSIKGYLEPRIAISVPLSLTVMAPANNVYVSQVDTDANGEFQFALPLTASGEWKIHANWRGNSEYESARSQTLAFRVFSEKGEELDKTGKAGRFLKKNTMIIGLVFLYVIIIRLYRD